MNKTKLPAGRLIALDVGGRYIGIAVSDELGIVASPVTAVDMKKQNLDELTRVIRLYDPVGVIVGMPKNMSGSEGQQAQKTRQFVEQLATALLGVPVVYWDERLTTFMADQALAEMGHSSRKRKERVDAIAASFILQSYLEAHR